MKRFPQTVFAMAVMLLSALACTEEQDFDQINDLQVTPTLASGLFYLESDEATINSAGSLNTFYYQETNFNAFNETYVADNLLEGTITYEIDNSTSKQLRVIIGFIDDSGNILDVETFDIEAGPTDTVVREVFYGPGGKRLQILTNTSSLRVSATNLSDANSVSPAEDPKIILRSGAEFLFQLQ
ncbi:MAG: hypothetical protein VX772_03650 [Bacteroidota bacterium]|nr:hypothetical protein [Bacteroidota bacterium]